MSTVKRLSDLGLIHPPNFLPSNMHYETIMGSMAYGVSSDSSDMDIYGFCIPPKNIIFPHLSGEIFGFGKQVKRFDQWQEHGIIDPTALSNKGRTYDFSIYSIIKYFQLCMENNPNMIDSLFTPHTCILHITKIGNMMRDSRKLFLHKGAWYKFKGYAYSQIHKMQNKNPIGKRTEIIEKYGWDVKFGLHTVRLLNEIEQILTEGDLDLQRNNEQLKSIRRGEWKEQDVIDYFNTKERELESLYTSSKLQYSPDEEKIKSLLLACLEEHYGNLKDCVSIQGQAEKAIQEIKIILDRYQL